MRFIRSSFRGQLPKLFEPNLEGIKTQLMYKDFNDMNREEVSRYTKPELCHYLIDSSQPYTSDDEPDFSKDTKNWGIVSTHKILDLSRSPVVIRSFYLPFISERQNSYNDFRLLRNNNLFSNASTLKVH